jgi:peptide/nickel transport system substrate-binding protein
MLQKRLILVLGVLLTASMVLGACGPTPTPVPTAVATQPPAATAVPTEAPPPARHGGWLDQIVFSVVKADSAVTQIQAGAIDTFAYGLTSANLKSIQDAGLSYASSMGTYYDIMYMPATCTDPNTLNPFTDRKIREATNMLYDRNYINQEIYAGGALPKFFPITTNGIDYADLADVARGLEAKYAFNETKAIADIATEMTSLGATMGADGKWQFKGKPVNLIFLIRSDGDGSRKPMGDYVAAQLEKAGFTVDRQYKKGSEAAPIWQGTNVTCEWNVYTAGWGSTGLSRDDANMFQQMYLPDSVQGIEPLLSNVADPAFQKLGDDLANSVFTSVEQRREMMAEALALGMQDSLQVFIVDTQSYSPYNTNVQVAANLAAGIERGEISYYTARFIGQEGGVLKWGEADLFSEPWNPVAGSNWAWDGGAMAAMASGGIMDDPYTGLKWPLRAEKAELTIQKGLPIFKTLDWVTLTTADSIAVPADAWADWDATTQKFIPAGEGKTTKTKSTVYYPANMFDTVTWHDGQKLSAADFVMSMIMTFDRAKAESAIYDESAVGKYDSFMSSFKGVKITSTSPLVIETYSDFYYGDAEWDISTWWPYYGCCYISEFPWENIAIGNLAEAAGEIAYSIDKSSATTIEQTSYVGGPTLAVLAKYLDQAIADKTIPYAPTMSAYLTADEAVARYTALKQWYADRGHFWLGTGPYYLDKAYLVEKSLILQNYSAFPDTPDRWANFAAPHIAVVDITGPAGSVKIGAPATFDVAVTFGGQPYASADLKMVKYLLYDATGAVVKSDLATLVSEGNYQVVLPAELTAAMAAGSYKLEIAVVSNLVAVPTFSSVSFVTAP